MIVVTGATGNVGRALVDQLTTADTPVRALVRDPRRAHLPTTAETTRLTVSADATDMTAQFDGADALFLHASATGEHTTAFLAAARTAGVQHVTVLSSIAVEDDPAHDTFIHTWHRTLEQDVRDSGLDWTFLRPGGFATNTLQWAWQIHDGDTVRGPYAKSVSTPIHEADIAAVARHSLLERHSGTAHVLTGPEAVTTEDQIAAIAHAIGRPLTYTEIPPHDVVPEMFPIIPADMVPGFVASLATTVDTAPPLTTTVQTVTGNPARTYAQWAQDHADDFRTQN
ncbi:SDR family oxidoreductase [Streptomyces sp. NRRL B-1347]|uniref:SDR family oxidoreductase n=1 Tax=Streptomyces sp. NRRL B-1347 TaxID=1476877 RepID=UPI0004CC8173|nr:NAD(P)H-binding protein [Streptomyces sp. NRRL B-1347]